MYIPACASVSDSALGESAGDPPVGASTSGSALGESCGRKSLVGENASCSPVGEWVLR